MTLHPFTIEALADCALMYPSVNLDINDDDFDSVGMIDIQSFAVAIPNQGVGTAAMQHITHLADKHRVSLEIYAGVEDDGCDAVRLINFYGRFDFYLQNTPWDTKCASMRPWLIRRPQ